MYHKKQTSQSCEPAAGCEHFTGYTTEPAISVGGIIIVIIDIILIAVI